MIPVVMLEPKNLAFWGPWSKFIEEDVMGKGFISVSDKSLYRVFNTPADALGHIDFFYKNYHSMRFVKDVAVVRLKKALTAAVLAEAQS